MQFASNSLAYTQLEMVWLNALQMRISMNVHFHVNGANRLRCASNAN